jgi:hypothetical protein
VNLKIVFFIVFFFKFLSLQKNKEISERDTFYYIAEMQKQQKVGDKEQMLALVSPGGARNGIG